MILDRKKSTVEFTGQETPNYMINIIKSMVDSLKSNLTIHGKVPDQIIEIATNLGIKVN